MTGSQSNSKDAYIFAEAASVSWAPFVFGALFAAGLTLIAITPIPAMSDYLNHLARIYLIVSQRAGAPSPYYEVQWAFYPNLAMDLGASWLAQWLGVELASRLFVLISQFLMVSGAVAIELAVKRRFEYAGFIALAFFCSFPFAWGFVNYLFGFGVALWGIASWLVLREKPAILRFAVHVAFFLVLSASHLVALGIYGFTLGVHECWRAYRFRPPLIDAARDWALLVAPALIGAVIFLAGAGSVGGEGTVWGLQRKYIWLVLAMNGYSPLLSGACFIGLAVLVWRLARAKKLVCEASGAWQAWGFLVLYLAMPTILSRTALVDVRIVVAAAVILPGFVSIQISDGRRRRTTMLAVVAMIVVNLGSMTAVWTAYRSDYREIIESFSHLPKAPRILVAKTSDDTEPGFLPMYHAPVLATHYADALVSTTMAVKGKQPLISRSSFERLNANDAPPPTVSELEAAAQAGANAQDQDEYLRHWARDFDYVYLIGSRIQNPMPNRLEEVESHRRFTLYRIRKS